MKQGLAGDLVLSLLLDSRGFIWAGTVTNLPFIPLRLLMDSENRLWIGGYQQFGQYIVSNHTIDPIDGYKGHTTCVIEDRYKNIWIGTREGLYRYNLKTGELRVFKNNPHSSWGLSNSRISCLMIDEQGTIWVGTLGGVNKIVPGTESSQPQFTYWNTSNSNLPFDAIAGIVEDDDGILWISSGNQISHFFSEEVAFRNYDQSDGLYGGGVYGGLKGPSGAIYMSSRDGLVIFHPHSLQDNSYVPPVVITALSINNHLVAKSGSRNDTTSWKSPLMTAIPYTKSLELSYNHRDFTLEFAALNYIYPENNRYKNKLEPYELDWIETGASNRTVRYTSMRPGKYTFRVIGSNNDGVWNEQGQRLEITIKPPLWATWWAYTFYALCVAGWVIALRHYEKKRIILQQKARLLEEIDRAKTEFFTNISHELRTPLTLILGSLKSLQQGTHKGDKDSIYSVMSQNGRRLVQLVDQLLDLSKLDQGKLELELHNCNISELVQQVLANFDSACFLKNIELEFHDSPNPIRCRVDEEKMRQVLYNLLSNAIKFTPENGHIKVSVNSNHNQQAGHQKTTFSITVRDSGIGIPKEELDHIFDRFYQIKHAHQDESEGSGIGLALAQKLVHLHEGTIEVESEPGWGAAFKVILPLIKAEEQQQIVENPIPKTNSSQQARPADTIHTHTHTPTQSIHGYTRTSHSAPTLLLVEDNIQMREYIRSSLGGDYQYLEAANGEQGLELAVEEIPDLILCDVMMPKMDGFELCTYLRKEQVTAHIPFIFITAKANLNSRLLGLEIGSDDYVTKPYEPDELRLKVRNHLNKMQQCRSYFSKQLTINGDIEIVESLDDAFLNRVVKAVEDQLDNNEFTVEEFARTIGMSKTQLYRKLITLTGQSPSVFIRSIRLKKAAQLILQEYGNTSEVAYAVGFNNLSYFTKCFKEQFGTVPSGYGKKRVSG